ncbi:hypothetical protein A2U01_0114117, partial [Trifolium medium]|nr:hypothetical protein [Trifolium medium]
MKTLRSFSLTAASGIDKILGFGPASCTWTFVRATGSLRAPNLTTMSPTRTSSGEPDPPLTES